MQVRLLTTTDTLLAAMAAAMAGESLGVGILNYMPLPEVVS